MLFEFCTFIIPNTFKNLNRNLESKSFIQCRRDGAVYFVTTSGSGGDGGGTRQRWVSMGKEVGHVTYGNVSKFIALLLQQNKHKQYWIYIYILSLIFFRVHKEYLPTHVSHVNTLQIMSIGSIIPS